MGNPKRPASRSGRFSQSRSSNKGSEFGSKTDIWLGCTIPRASSCSLQATLGFPQKGNSLTQDHNGQCILSRDLLGIEFLIEQ